MRYSNKMDISPNRSMFVVKRDGRREEVSFDKVLERIKRASESLSVNPTAIAQKILAQIYDGVKTTELDELTSQLAANLATVHPDYGTLAARISVSNHHKNTEPQFSKVMRALATQIAPKTGEPISYIGQELLDVIDIHGALKNHPELLRDGVHPTTAGATVMAKTVFQALTGREFTGPSPVVVAEKKNQ